MCDCGLPEMGSLKVLWVGEWSGALVGVKGVGWVGGGGGGGGGGRGVNGVGGCVNGWWWWEWGAMFSLISVVDSLIPGRRHHS